MQLCWFIAIGTRFWLSYLVFWIVSSLVLSKYPSLWEELAKYFDPSSSFLTSGSHYTNARKDFTKWKIKLSRIQLQCWVWIRQVQKGDWGALRLWLISQHAPCLPNMLASCLALFPWDLVELGCEMSLCCLQILQYHARTLLSSLLNEHDDN